MARPHKALQTAYGLTAVAALIGTWSNNIQFYLADPDAGLIGFIEGAFANYASASLTMDLLLLGVTIFIWMFVESRRLKMKGIGVYFTLSLLIAIAVMVPIFMLMRERKLAELAATKIEAETEALA